MTIEWSVTGSGGVRCKYGSLTCQGGAVKSQQRSLECRWKHVENSMIFQRHSNDASMQSVYISIWICWNFNVSLLKFRRVTVGVSTASHWYFNELPWEAINHHCPTGVWGMLSSDAVVLAYALICSRGSVFKCRDGGALAWVLSNYWNKILPL